MNYQLAFWAATGVAAFFLFVVLWACRMAVRTQRYNNRLLVEVLTSHKVRDEALAKLKDLGHGLSV
jgi:hypothetical protein